MRRRMRSRTTRVSAIGRWELRLIKREITREKLLDVIDATIVPLLTVWLATFQMRHAWTARWLKRQDALYLLIDESATWVVSGRRPANGHRLYNDLPEQPIIVHGLEARLAQVFFFVNF